jgi:hypothetical protein
MRTRSNPGSSSIARACLETHIQPEKSILFALWTFCWFFTGFHDDYHEESDTFDKANIEDMTRIVDLGFRMVLERAGRVD